jgi:hypothetical protein
MGGRFHNIHPMGKSMKNFFEVPFFGPLAATLAILTILAYWAITGKGKGLRDEVDMHNIGQ